MIEWVTEYSSAVTILSLALMVACFIGQAALWERLDEFEKTVNKEITDAMTKWFEANTVAPEEEKKE